MNSPDPSAVMSVFWTRLLGIAPILGAALLTLLVGLLLAWLSHLLVRWIVRKLHIDGLLERIGAARVLHGMGLRMGVDELAGRIAGWTIVLVTLSAVLDVLGLGFISSGVAGLVQYLPQLLAGLAILVGGLVLADLLRNLTVRVGQDRGDLAAPSMAGDIVYYMVLALTFTLAADQVGLALDLVHHLILIAVGTVLAGFGLSFALAGQSSFRNLIARHYAEQLYAPGDELVIGDVRGLLVRYDALTVTLRTLDGEVTLPCTQLFDRAVEVLQPPLDGDLPDVDLGPDAT